MLTFLSALAVRSLLLHFVSLRVAPEGCAASPEWSDEKRRVTTKYYLNVCCAECVDCEA